jgi:hypothetical protein
MTLLSRLPAFPLYYNGNTKFMPIHCSDLTNTIYHIISKTVEPKKKFERIKIFLHWLNIKNKYFQSENSIEFSRVKTLINDWNQLLTSLMKYEILRKSSGNKILTLQSDWLETLTLNSQNLKRLNKISVTQSGQNKLLEYYHQINQLDVLQKLLVILIGSYSNVKQVNYFKFLNQNVNSTTETLEKLIVQTQQQKLKPVFYFSSTLKELFKYKQKKKKTKDTE